MARIAHPVLDFGGTHCRIGWAAREVADRKFSGIPRILRSQKFVNPLNAIHQPNLAKTLEKAREIIQGSMPSDMTVLKAVGASLPGAWLENGLVYPATPNNTLELENYRFAEEFSKMIGPGWRTFINNDGVANVLAIANGLMANISRFQEVQIALQRCNKIVGFIPGTGFGAGAFTLQEGQLVPVPGPQQFFDVIIGRGNGVVDKNHIFITPEDLIAGLGLSFQAKNSILAGRYSEEQLSTQKIGPLLSRLAFSKDKSIKGDEREAARSIYQGTGNAIAETMILTFDGPTNGESRKLIVNDPPVLETQFWAGVRGTEVFILGGWLTNPEVKGFVGDIVRGGLKRSGYQNLQVVFADDIPGVSEMLESDSAALMGASLLVPESAII